MKRMTSLVDLPCSSRASKPENLSRGPKNPPTLESMGISVWGERVTTRDLPVPAYWVMPHTGPGLMMISFSGSFQRVVGWTAFQRW